MGKRLQSNKIDIAHFFYIQSEVEKRRASPRSDNASDSIVNLDVQFSQKANFFRWQRICKVHAQLGKPKK